jgi:hypothetical protein
MVRLKHTLTGLFVSVLCGGAAAFAIVSTNVIPGMDQRMLLGAGGLVAIGVLFTWVSLVFKSFSSRYHRSRLKDLDELTPIENQTRRDSWGAIRDLVSVYLKKTSGRFKLREVKREYTAVRQVYDKGSREIREALNELATISNDKPADIHDSKGTETALQNSTEGKPLHRVK